MIHNITPIISKKYCTWVDKCFDFSASCLTLWRSWVWNGLPQRNCPIAAWMNGSCQGTARAQPGHSQAPRQRALPFFSEVHDEINKSWRVPYYMPLLLLPSLRLKAQKKKDTTACLPWMSQWPRISAHPRPLAGRQKQPTHPNRVGRLQLSLDEPIRRLDNRPLCFTPWWSCKCSRQNSSAPWMSLTRTPQLSTSCAVRPTWPCMPPK